MFVVAAFLLAACASSPPPPGVSTDLPDPQVSTLIAASRTAGPTATRSSASPTPGLRLPLIATVLLRVRSGPGLGFDTLALMQPGEAASAVGRNDAGDWLLIEYAAEAKRGWVFGELTQVEGDLESLPVVNEVVSAATLPAAQGFTPLPEATSTPLPPGFPTPTSTSTGAVAIQPEIGFYADTLLVTYKAPCTYLRWIARPVQAVYLDGESMAGRNFIAICPAIPSQTYTLEVVRLDGRHVVLELTVENEGIP